MSREGWRRSHEAISDVTAAEALILFAQKAGSAAIGFYYTPTETRWFRLGTAGPPTGPDGAGLELGGIFELRAFTMDVELRWLNVSAGRGTGVIVRDDSDVESADSVVRARRGASYRRLLWGKPSERAGPVGGWLPLYDSRIGTIKVPVDGPASKDTRVWLEAVEYVQEDEHGNAAVIDERLTALHVSKGVAPCPSH